jgi:hypothetical protein
MAYKTSKFLLLSALFSTYDRKSNINLYPENPKDHVIYMSHISSIQREDGSGYKFNVTGYENGVEKTVFVVTTD